jgi:ATP-dependent Lon protease
VFLRRPVLWKEIAVSITLARTRSLYDLADVYGALERSKGRAPELEAFYERMLDTGAERFLTTPSSSEALAPLAEECPNFDEVVGDLTRYLGLAHAGDGGFNVMPILLLGDPGVGKTHFARRLAKAMQTECELISMNALSAGFVITGSSASWKGAKCGKVAERLVRGQYANPVVVLDEVEKASGSSQSDPLAALYQLLEPETARAFRDEYIDVEIDASQIFWILTANRTEGIPAPLLNRMAVYEVPAPTAQQAAGIAQGIYAALLRELKLVKFAARLDGAVVDRMAGVSPRDMRKTLLDALGYAVAAERQEVMAEDVRVRPAPGKSRIGF